MKKIVVLLSFLWITGNVSAQLDTLFWFVAAVIGGLESLFGAVAGAMLLGFAISFATSYVSEKLVFPMAFIMLIVVLLIRPAGLFSKKKGRRD